jgi:hypothetical protein
MPFSFLGAGQAAPMVVDPGAAFADLLGFLPPTAGATKTPTDVLQRSRVSVLDTVAKEYEVMATKLMRGGRQKLEQHRSLIRELETSLGAVSARTCDGAFNNSGHMVTQFMRLVRMALACDLTRIVTFVAPVPQCPEFGYRESAVVHPSYAHAAIEGSTACGAMFTHEAERAMTDLGVWYAGHFALLLQELDSVAEGSGTLLDHSVVVWQTELGLPTHQHENSPVLLAGGCNDFFRTGRYVRYPRNLPSPIAGNPKTGPAHNRLFVSLMQAMGQSDTSFGMADAVSASGDPLSLRGPLEELHRV